MATTKNLSCQDFFSTTLAQDLTNSATTIYLNSVPTASEGFLVLEDDNLSKREIIYYNAKGANYVTAAGGAGVGRGMGGTTAQSHTSGATVDMNMTSGYWKALQDGTALADSAVAERSVNLPSFPKLVNRQNNVTNATVSDQLIQTGWGFVPANGAAYASESVTYPVAFDAAPIVTVTAVGRRDGSDPTAVSDFNLGVDTYAHIDANSATGFTVTLESVSAGAQASGRRLGYTWIAIGTKAR